MEKHPNSTLAYSAAALLVAALAGGAYAFAHLPDRSIGNGTVATVTPSPAGVPTASHSANAPASPSPAATPDVTVGWKIRIDAPARISYKYPQSGYLANFDRAPEWKNARNVSWTEFRKEEKLGGCSDEFCNYSTLIGIKSYKYTWAEAKSAHVLPDGVDDLAAISVGGETGRLWNEEGSPRQDGGIERRVFVESNGRTYHLFFVISTIADTDVQELFRKESGIFTALLNTVKFQ